MSASGSKLHALRTTCCWFRRSKIRISYAVYRGLFLRDGHCPAPAAEIGISRACAACRRSRSRSAGAIISPSARIPATPFQTLDATAHGLLLVGGDWGPEVSDVHCHLHHHFGRLNTRHTSKNRDPRCLVTARTLLHDCRGDVLSVMPARAYSVTQLRH